EDAGEGTVLMPTVLDSPMKTRPLTDSPQQSEPTRVMPARTSPPAQGSNQNVGTRRRTLLVGFIVAFIAAFIAAAVYLNLPDNNRPHDGNVNAPATPN